MAAVSLQGWISEDQKSLPWSLLAFCSSSTTCFTASSPSEQSCTSIRLVSFSALLLFLSCIQLTCQRCKHLGGRPAQTLMTVYCFLGSICGFTGAVLSRQLHIQVLRELVSAFVGGVNIFSCCLPLCLFRDLHAERRRRMVRRRRRRHLLAVCLLTALTGAVLKSGVLGSPEDSLIRGRKLLYVTLQDNTEILGYILGLLSFVITSTSRFPALSRVNKGKMRPGVDIFSAALCSLAGALYAAAILHYRTGLSFLLRVLPWLLAAVCGASLDFLIVVLHLCNVGTRQPPISFSPEMESLLADSSENNAVMVTHEHAAPSSAHGKDKKLHLTEMGRYMDVSIHATRQLCPKKVTVSGEVVHDQARSRTVPMWDFEEGNARWSEAQAKQGGDEFPLQEWPSNPKPFSVGTYASCALPQNRVSCNDAAGLSK
ncbi:transmembrane protein 44 isoform X2 [Dunckerocampus dactyliophorus]|uniref:transmembrane protein 44 isoform X2 n=1 Tax=Dunckerocampus dactyliophorus TaxID=161453 RepID=UPI002405857F|nr:transmembrane protein 44 isoform X2 [Dunckerocampus dactyliophorus]